ncbi:twin-arginine translocation signal domain-containing protein, partial [Mesorhizobium sp. M2E.F.Ca.ET.166.01.1.1]|uniref:twin-arginine translocation signal domain-containing protein n=1 Tax=Mesorhizobium sp. M2E.F.Ca.ET.166.01.1.1 TaxID=2500523 RepID=UPI001FEEE659
MTKRIGTATTLKGMSRRDFLARSALTAGLLVAGQSLFIDGGTTNEALARAIPRDIQLTVATNSLGVASALTDLPLVELIVLGGRYVPDLGT